MGEAQVRLDATAKRIIELLQEDGRTSYAAIAKAVGLSEAAAVAFLGAQWRGAVAFVILIAVLLVRPGGLFGSAG